MYLYGFCINLKWEEPLGRPRLRQDDNIKKCEGCRLFIWFSIWISEATSCPIKRRQFLDKLSNCQWSATCCLLKPPTWCYLVSDGGHFLFVFIKRAGFSRTELRMRLSCRLEVDGLGRGSWWGEQYGRWHPGQGLGHRAHGGCRVDERLR
jgi:hypothetical protein